MILLSTCVQKQNKFNFSALNASLKSFHCFCVNYLNSCGYNVSQLYTGFTAVDIQLDALSITSFTPDVTWCHGKNPFSVCGNRNNHLFGTAVESRNSVEQQQRRQCHLQKTTLHQLKKTWECLRRCLIDKGLRVYSHYDGKAAFACVFPLLCMWCTAAALCGHPWRAEWSGSVANVHICWTLTHTVLTFVGSASHNWQWTN